MFDCAECFAKQAIDERPDLVFVLTARIHLEQLLPQIDDIRDRDIKTAVWFLDDPFNPDLHVPIAKHFEYVFSQDSNGLEVYEQLGCDTHHLPLCAFPEHYYPLNNPASLSKPVVFIGSSSEYRHRFFELIMNKLMSFNVEIIGFSWEETLYKYYPNSFKNKWLDIQQTNEVYNCSKIILNLHRSEHDVTNHNKEYNKIAGCSPNPRTFEALAAGAFQLTDVREDLSKFYTSGREIETYTSQEDLLEKIEYYLIHEEERQQIATRGYERTLKEHTYAHRLDQMLAIVFHET